MVKFVFNKIYFLIYLFSVILLPIKESDPIVPALIQNTVIVSFLELSASFKPETSVRYTFKEPYELTRNSSTLPSSIYSDTTLRGENVSMSFRTVQSPALLLYVNSYYSEYMAVLINKHGEKVLFFILFKNLGFRGNIFTSFST